MYVLTNSSSSHSQHQHSLRPSHLHILTHVLWRYPPPQTRHRAQGHPRFARRQRRGPASTAPANALRTGRPTTAPCPSVLVHVRTPLSASCLLSSDTNRSAFPGQGVNCNNHGTCNTTSSPFFCDCDEHWTGNDCSVRTRLLAPHSRRSVKSRHLPFLTLCLVDASVTAICAQDCSGHGKCSSDKDPPVCACDPYWGGAGCSERRSSSGLSEPDTIGIAVGVVAGTLGLGTLHSPSSHFITRQEG
jgi:hypothetical protein